ncbi:hypothetical protein [Yinghuangia aomiensis]
MAGDRDAPFVIGVVARPARRTRKVQNGALAVRFPCPRGAAGFFAPAAYIGRPNSDIPSYLLHDARDPNVLVCAVAPNPVDDARYRVTDAHHHRELGHPDIVARYAWAKGTSKEVASRGVAGVGRLVGDLVESAIFGPDDAAPGKQYMATWHADDEVVMTSGYLESVRTYRPAAPWFDRRLAFALAVIRHG